MRIDELTIVDVACLVCAVCGVIMLAVSYALNNVTARIGDEVRRNVRIILRREEIARRSRDQKRSSD